MNKKAQFEFDEINIFGVIGAILGGMFAVFITHQMEGGTFLKIMGFAVTGAVCYFVASKIADG